MMAVTRYFAVLWWLALVVGVSHAQDAPTTPQQQQQTPVPPPSINQQSTTADYYKINCERPDGHDAADLCEQRRMAQAAEDSVYWARVQALIGFVGFVGVLVTLIFTGLGTRAASQQVRLSRHALISTDRAFCFPKDTIWRHVDDAEGRIQQWRVAVRWENSGKTPPRYVRIQTVAMVGINEIPNDFDFSSIPITVNTQLLIPPNNTIESDELPVTLEQTEDIIAGRQHLYIWGWIEYDDVFERTPRHRTEFCHKWFLGGDPRSAEPDRFPKRYAVHERHNAADDECEYPLRTASPRDVGDR